VLRRIFGPKREELAGDWRRLYYEELRNLYTLTNTARMKISRRMRWARHAVRMREMRSVHKTSVGKPARKRLPRRHRCR
jgi:hypothetical protein